ncbi:mg394 protein [Tupanvirus deep ocean]|uniref:Mg394 protein n=2 Tax=Tupanvirus TaxID=2094720 RepID=A0AC62A962_9VIRU|nr:mg394 protein [Tupanvirus deep ocean]QKU34212.1 mg394 protein [Tupanvirus deep ocean]
MIQTKYLIIIGAIICLLVLYYFYDEINSVKKLFVPTYQKTMALEAKVLELEKKANEITQKKKPMIQKIDSPALSITYQSDMVKNGNLSVKYADLSDTEAKELLKHIDQNKARQQQIIYNNLQQNQQPINQTQQQMQQQQMQQQMQQVPKRNFNVQSGDISDFLPANNENNKTKHNEFMEETETINFKIGDVLKKNSMSTINLESKEDHAEMQKILDGFSKNSGIHSEDVFDNDTEIDQDIIKSISESIQYADLPSDTILSDLPVVKAPKKIGKNKKIPPKKILNNNKKNISK